MGNDDMITPKEAARLLYVHTNTLKRWSDQGIIKTYRIGPRGDRRFNQGDIARFLIERNPYNNNKRKVRSFGTSVVSWKPSS
ncbi:helix-turn-helix domain-containing protein [Chloroflexota bacterium]